MVFGAKGGPVDNASRRRFHRESDSYPPGDAAMRNRATGPLRSASRRRRRSNRLFALVPLAMLAGALSIECQHSVLPPPIAQGSCPDDSKVEFVEQFDFAREYHLRPDVGAKIKLGVAAAESLRALLAKVDAELLDACSGLAVALNDPTRYPDAQAACRGALAAVNDAKAKLGPDASLHLEVEEAPCLIDMAEYRDCAARCDPNWRSRSRELRCTGAIEGHCSGRCTGLCELSSPAPTTQAGSCAGLCRGECSEPMASPRCAGTILADSVNASCKAACDARVGSRASCSPSHVRVRISNASDTAAEATLRRALERYSPRLIDIGKGASQTSAAVSENVAAIVEAEQAVVQQGNNYASASRLGACVAPSFAGGLRAAARFQNAKVNPTTLLASIGPTSVPASDHESPYFETQVFYGTDRNATDRTDPYEHYSVERGSLEFGTCTVAIPKDHEAGELESHAWWKFRLRDDPAKDVTLLSVTPTTEDRFLSELRSRIDGSSRRRALIFIHGYNVNFGDAIRRTAQLAFDLNFDGAAIAYSWPSRGESVPYVADEANADWTGPDLRRFLGVVATQSGANEASIIVHSMGNRALAAALNDLAANPTIGPMQVHEVVLAAPDLDKDTFRTIVAPKFALLGSRVTLYASSRDRALEASKKLHGYPRAGDSSEGVVVVPGVESVDVSRADPSFLGHSYFAGRPCVLSDVHAVVVEHAKPKDRQWISPISNSAGLYWMFRPQR
jgi:esterase/lipase superfamily enzyme